MSSVPRRVKKGAGAAGLGGIPIFGIWRATTNHSRWLALLSAFLSVFFGSIGIWLPLSISYGIDPNAKLVARDIFILVPSLVAPLYILLIYLSRGARLRSHQVALILLSSMLSIVSLVYWARSSSSPKDNLTSYLCWMIAVSFFLLFYYYLHLNVNDAEVGDEVKSSEKSVAADLVEIRKREGKE